MIIQRLVELYDRLDKEDKVPKYGWKVTKVHYCLVIDEEGNLITVEDLTDGGKPSLMVLPGVDHTNAVRPCLNGWDTKKYMLGIPKGKTADVRHKAYVEEVLAREQEVGLKAYSAFCRFLEKWNPDDAEKHPLLIDEKITTGVVRMQGDTSYLHELLDVVIDEDGPADICSVTGEQSIIARKHEIKLKGVAGSAGGSCLVSYNIDSAESFGKKQGYNASISKKVAFKYATALNWLLSSERNRVRIGDTTMVFWAAGDDGGVADVFSFSIRSPTKKGQEEQLKSFLNRIRKGLPGLVEKDTPFYILGLTGNRMRTRVLMWQESSVGSLARKLLAHHKRLHLDVLDTPMSIYDILRAASRIKGDGSAVIPDHLVPPLQRAIIDDTAYPIGIYMRLLGRMRIDKYISAKRMAVVKAILVKNFGKEISVSLDEENTSIGYLYGRLFALCEYVQKKARPNINKTIKDTYFGYAFMRPATVFPQLMRRLPHDLGKIESEGTRIWIDGIIQKVYSKICSFARTLPLDEQGMFSIGYYHQREDLYTKKVDKTTKESE